MKLWKDHGSRQVAVDSVNQKDEVADGHAGKRM
jgi:hypothetical protein